MLIVITALLVGCSREARPPAEVKRAIAQGLAEIDRVDSGSVGMNLPILMTACIPRVRAYWEHAAMLLERADAGSGKHADLQAQLQDAIATCQRLEAENPSEGAPWVSIIDEGLDRVGGQLAQRLNLQMKPPRAPTDKESWFDPEKIQVLN